MKKLVMSFVGLLVFACTFAQTTDKNAVTMVAYEQSWSDSEATIALKNNTSEDIENIAFRIYYFDASGTQVDYKEFTRDVSIAPGLTKRISIRAFDDSHYSHYIKSKGSSPSDSKAFDVKFELLSYNQPLAFSLSASDFDEPNVIGMGVILFILFIFLVIGVLLLVLVGKMARKRNRNVLLWLLLSVLISPLPIIIILLIIGDDLTEQYRQPGDRWER